MPKERGEERQKKNMRSRGVGGGGAAGGRRAKVINNKGGEGAGIVWLEMGIESGGQG